jgi:hypothetical protein
LSTAGSASLAAGASHIAGERTLGLVTECAPPAYGKTR